MDEIFSFTPLFCVSYSKNKTAFRGKEAFALILAPRSPMPGKDEFSKFLSVPFYYE